MNTTSIDAPTSSRALAAVIHFLPFLVVPQSVNNLVNIVSFFIFLACFSLTYNKGIAPTISRLVLFCLVVYVGHPLLTEDHIVPRRTISPIITFNGAILLFKAFDICIVSLWDQQPPHWVRNGKRVPLPRALLGRIGYAFDLFSTVRGSSWFEGYSWDWAPAYVASYSPPVRSRFAYAARGILYLGFCYISLDVFESITRLETWELPLARPVLSQPMSTQLLHSFCFCVIMYFGMTISHALFATLLVALGSSPKAWVPPFPRNPFTATSLQDFWSNTWHHYFKRSLKRAVIPIMMLVPQRWPWSMRRVIRAVIIFGMNTIIHLYIVARISSSLNPNAGPAWRFIDKSTLIFFLLQPIGLLIEREVLIPLSTSLLRAHPSVRAWLIRLWAWSWLVWTGRYWLDVWVRSGMWSPGEGYLGWSPIRGLLFGQWFVM
ncbi:hypothetical protein DL93DRAFT_2232099 [Clavulina sp. PMI_390]|nr:hypothetical protein DL93DRAFT_2232099 [Clavulina sp. PMI_390]